MNVTFDGPERMIIVNDYVTELDVRTDIYSGWKEWLLMNDNAKFPIAITPIGGDPISETMTLGSTFILENGWRIRPYEGSHALTIRGNIYTREGDSPITATLGSFNVLVEMARSNLVDTVTMSAKLNIMEQKIDDTQAFAIAM